jgi:CRISPR/Cas system-associated endonuclease Cas1
MESIYVIEPGSYLRREGAALKLVKDGRTLEEIPADGLKRLMLVGICLIDRRGAGLLDQPAEWKRSS